MIPLQITAHLASAVAMQHPIALDGLLAAMVAARDGYPPPSLETRIPPPESVPLLWHPAGFHHASQAHLSIAAYDTVRWCRKAPGLRELAILTDTDKVQLGGRWKAYWMPLRLVLPAGMQLVWWAVGDKLAVAELLRHCHSLGSKRNAGHGWVSRWTIEEWPADWSLLRPDESGALVPSRPLPIDLAPAGWLQMDRRWLTYPYWRAGNPPLVAVPPAVEIETEAWD